MSDEVQSEVVTAALAARWRALFQLEDEPDDAPVPQGLHWATCVPPTQQRLLDADGHPLRGGLIPVDLPPRRMWAGTKVQFLAEIRPGETLTRRSRLVKRTDKHGTSGALIFLEIEHRLAAEDGVRVLEQQTIVYRNPATLELTPGLPPPMDVRQSVVPDETMLFRFSALTWNAHRIHYDRRYAMEVEGYPGLVVQGPLIAALFLNLCAQEGLRVEHFDHRARAPSFAGEAVNIGFARTSDGADLAAWASDGRFLATAHVAASAA